MQNDHSVAAHWSGAFDEAQFSAWAEKMRKQLKSPRVDLGLVFLGPKYVDIAAQVLEIIRVRAEVPLLAGCSSASLIAGSEEIEADAGLVLGLYSLPGAELRGMRFTQQQLDESSGPAYWHQENEVTPDRTNGWLCFADPYHLDCETWLRSWNEAYPRKPILGGLASNDGSSESTQVYLNGDVFEDGGIALSVGGRIELAGMISQGCTPIGDTWTITRAERNLIREIGNRPAYEVLAETFAQLTPEQQKQAQGNLFVGLVVNEYMEEFQRGDFLIRNLIGVDPNSGTIGIGAYPRPGQTMQFQCRLASAGTEDLEALLARAEKQIGKRRIYGGCLCSCNGRGRRLFGQPSHDARHVQEHLGPLGLAGFFCNGELGPVGERNFLHGYTASLALFVDKQPAAQPS
ncbi:MAG TPA: FIST N-terminal domain-containing protein [Verrucomicrobiae bacterium]|nr:FIST N-terminal domain-containing protein [Verrucomicrobiae bacterium]